ncbi:MAG: HEAT repeat domain-containing protein [Planctomycetota bacterium]|jgi:hypothetical protein
MLKLSRLLPGLLLATALSQTVLACPRDVALSPQGSKQQSQNDKVLRTIRSWLKLYRSHTLEPDAYLIGSKSLLKKADLEDLARRSGRGGGLRRGTGRGMVRAPGRTGRQELQILLRAAQRIGTVNAAKTVLEVAAVGIDRRYKYTTGMIPHTIRSMGERALERMGGDSVRGYILAAAKGEPDGPRGLKVALQIAALRALAKDDGTRHVRLFENLLSHSDALVRLATAEGLGRIGEPRSVEPLSVALENETSQTTMIALVWAIREVHRCNRDKVKVDHLRRAVIAAGRHLAKVDQRPTGAALIDFLERFRYRESVPCLIALLERIKSDPSLIRADSLTAALRQRANEVLCALTGAFFAMNRPDQWREFWERDGHKIQVDKIAANASAKQQKKGHTVTGEFFGIPVRGRRVVFIIDVSGSMEWPMPQRGSGTSSDRNAGEIRKIDKAKKELLKAVEGLPPENKFNVVFYANEVRRWKKKKKLVPASASNKKSLASTLRGEKANGGTNLFGGLKMGLELKSLIYGGRYDTNVDEIFVLSDGVPTVGDVIEMDEILRLIGETNRYSGVRINAIYLGSHSDERHPGNRGKSEREGGEFMKKLAEQNGGRFVWPVK